MTHNGKTKLCPACGKQTPEAARCVHCAAALNPSTPRKLLSSDMPGADYGVFLLAIPLIAIVGLLLTAFAAHSVSGFVWLLALTALITAGFAAGEVFQSPAAWSSGSPLKPMFRWLGFVALLWPVGYPAYLHGRHRFKLGNWLIAALIADTKFEFGLDKDDQLMLIDEALTPDSSRFWPADTYHPGISPPSFDKQYVRDYLETLNWDKKPPAPRLPAKIIAKTAEKYREAYKRLTT